MKELDVYLEAASAGLPWKKAKEVRAELEDHILTKAELLCLSGQTMDSAIKEVLAEMGDADDLSDDFRQVYPENGLSILMTSLFILLAAFLLFFIQPKSLLETLYFDKNVDIGNGPVYEAIRNAPTEQVFSYIRICFVRKLFDWNIVILQMANLLGSILFACSMRMLRQCSHWLRIGSWLAFIQIALLTVGDVLVMAVEVPAVWYPFLMWLTFSIKSAMFFCAGMGLARMAKRYYIPTSIGGLVAWFWLTFFLPAVFTRAVDKITLFAVFASSMAVPLVLLTKSLWKREAIEPVTPITGIRRKLAWILLPLAAIAGIMALLWMLPYIFPAKTHMLEQVYWKGELLLWM